MVVGISRNFQGADLQAGLEEMMAGDAWKIPNKASKKLCFSVFSTTERLCFT